MLEENGEAIEDEYRLDEIQKTITSSLEKHENPELLVSRRQTRQIKYFKIPTRVNFEKDPHNIRTIMKVVTADRPGLLSKIAQAFLKCNIQLQIARISTIGAQVEDVFYITDQNNLPLEDKAEIEKLRETTINMLS